jgi:hypothetical protein
VSRVPSSVSPRSPIASAGALVLRCVLLRRVHLHRARVMLHAGIRRGRSRCGSHRRCGGGVRRRGRVFLRFARCKHERSSSEDGKALHLQSPCGGQWLINLRPCTRAAMQGTSGSYSTPCDRPVKVSRVTCPASSVRSAPISRTRPSHGTTPLDWRDYCCTTRATAPLRYRFNIKRLKRLSRSSPKSNARAARLRSTLAHNADSRHVAECSTRAPLVMS